MREENRVGADRIYARDKLKTMKMSISLNGLMEHQRQLIGELKAKSIKDNLSSGEAPNNLLAVENVANGCKQTWLDDAIGYS